MLPPAKLVPPVVQRTVNFVAFFPDLSHAGRRRARDLIGLPLGFGKTGEPVVPAWVVPLAAAT